MPTRPAAAPPGHNRDLADAVADASARYAAARPRSAALHAEAKAVMPGGNTRSSIHFDPFPFVVARSEGCFIEDVDGHRYLDALGDFTAGLYGHSEPVIREAIIAAAASGMGNGAPGEGEIRLGRLIRARFPAIERLRFCNSGTEANLYALSLARAATGRRKIVCFAGGYHGGVFAFAGGGSPMNVPFDWVVCRYNDAAGTAATIERLGSELAAVIVEPMLSNGGCITVLPDFLPTLRAKCTEVGALLIFDEVVTSRMGASGLQGRYHIRPDLTTLGKYIGGGMTFGAFGGRADIMDRMDPFAPGALPHAGTYNNNVFSMAAGYAGLSRIFTPERAEALFAEGEALRARLNDLCRAAAPSVQFTGQGSIMNVHFVGGAVTSPDDLAGEPKELFKLFHFDMMEAGIHLARRGQINLSLPVTAADRDRIAEAVARFLERRAPLLRGL